MQSVMRFGGGQVFQKTRFVSAEDGVLNEFEMMCQLRILFPFHFVVFNQTTCHLTAEANVEQVSRTGQLSEVNLDPDTLTDMVSIMVNKFAYKPSVKDIMDKYYEMFHGKNSANKKDFFNSPDSPEHSDQDSDTGGRTRLRTSWGLNEEE